ncbi:hypothetical protein QBC47DRAFT_366059 [Echria macrotheca]|uniref:Uncharacterized protein n=1 Tax=Echria macrotheca TaxID=438768 RepID=A0AAJ0F5V9_9PEZI|nr:hypothetical protein QBC47DRAFT_366059 [Echria macrotheca]
MREKNWRDPFAIKAVSNQGNSDLEFCHHQPNDPSNPPQTRNQIDGPPQTQDVDIPFHGRPLVVDITQEVLGEFRKAIQLIDKVVFNTSGPLLRPWYGDIDMVNNFAFSVRLACESLPPKMLFLESSDGSQLSDQLSKWYLDMNDWVLEFHTMKQELRESPYHWPKETYTTVVGLLYSFDEVMGNLENEALNHWYLYNTTHVAAGRVARALLTDRPIVRPTAVANPWLWIRILRESSLSPLIQRLKELDEFFQFNVLPIIDSCLSVIEGNETSTSDHPCQKPKWRTYMSKYMIKHAGEMRKGHERLTQLLEELEHVDSLFLDVQLMLDPVLWKLEGIRDGYETFGDEYHQKTGWQGRYWIELDVREVVYWPGKLIWISATTPTPSTGWAGR